MSALYMEAVTLLSVDLAWSAARRHETELSRHFLARQEYPGLGVLLPKYLSASCEMSQTLMLTMQRPWTLEDPEAEDHEVCLVTAFSAHLNIQTSLLLQFLSAIFCFFNLAMKLLPLFVLLTTTRGILSALTASDSQPKVSTLHISNTTISTIGARYAHLKPQPLTFTFIREPQNHTK